MLPRANRLPRTVRLGRTEKFSTPLFICKWTFTKNNTSRFAVVVSKKVDKRAVVRNSVRRTYQAWFLQVAGNFSPCVDMICIALPASKDVSVEALANAMGEVWLKKEGK